MDTVQNRRVLEYADEYADKVVNRLKEEMRKNPKFKISIDDIPEIITNAIVGACDWYDNQPDILLDKIINICIDAKANCEINNSNKTQTTKTQEDAEELSKILASMSGQRDGILKTNTDYISDDEDIWADAYVKPRFMRSNDFGRGGGISPFIW